MQSRTNQNLICSILCVDIVEHSRKLEFDQFHRKARLQDILQNALQGIPESGRFILDTGDGAAIAFFGAPEDALTVALFIAEGIDQDEAVYPQDPIELRSGIHLGPVRIMNDVNGIAHFVGDGLNATHRIMALARPGNTVVSRQYYDVVAPENPDAFRVLTSIGKRRDPEGREHELYIVGDLDAARGIQWGVWRRHMALRLRHAVRQPGMRWGTAGASIALMAGLLLPQMKNTSIPESLQAPVPAVAAQPVQQLSVQETKVERVQSRAKAQPIHPHKQTAEPTKTFAARLGQPIKETEKSVARTVCSDAERMLSKCS